MRLFSLLLGAVVGIGVSVAVMAQEAPEPSPAAGSEPLDSHTEARIRKYLERATCPRGYGADAPIMVRCSYLLEQRRASQQSRYERREMAQQRDLQERFHLREEPAAVEQTPFDPEGQGSEPLAVPQLEAKVRRYARGENCEGGGLTEEEHTRCVFLVRERDDVRAGALERRRQARLVERAKGRSAKREETARRSVVKPSGAEMREQVRPEGVLRDLAPAEEQEFDPEGPGSVSLSEAEENNLIRYVENQSCLRLSKEHLKQRCKYLVGLRRHRVREIVNRTESQLRERGLLSGVPISRGVLRQFREGIADVTAIIRTRNLNGFRRAPRTRGEAEEQFKEPVLLEGDRD